MQWGDGLGSIYLGEGLCRFCVWAPDAQKVEVHLLTPLERWVTLEKDAKGYHQAVIAEAPAGAQYFFRLDETREFPDPASRAQPQGVSGPSEIVDPVFPWDDWEWIGMASTDAIYYELHVGAFSGEGTFEAIIPHLEDLHDLGVTALELMPVAQFPGRRNWGYDGAYPFAAQNSYGGPRGFKMLVNACHRRGLAVVLDVVYNHLGPEGNYLREYGPYFTSCYQTPWGAALNFDQARSGEVRRYFIENALYWIRDFHVDALRLDAVHAIKDCSAYPFLAQLADVVHEQVGPSGRRAWLIAESDSNDSRLISPRALGGCGLDAQWNDDFHHALHVLLTGEQNGYYQDFQGLPDLKKACAEGYVYTGQYSAYRQRRHGRSSRAAEAGQLIVFAQNHDQVGNRMNGERLSSLVSFEKLKLAAGAVLLSPFPPLLFMGEEYGETAPFLYFTSHGDPQLVEAVREGRRNEFKDFAWNGEVPDPHAEQTFDRSKLHHDLRRHGRNQIIYEFYRELINFRKTLPALRRLDMDSLEAACVPWDGLFLLRRWNEDSHVVTVFNFGPKRVAARLRAPAGAWRKLLDSEAAKWDGGGAAAPALLHSAGDLSFFIEPYSFVVYSMNEDLNNETEPQTKK